MVDEDLERRAEELRDIAGRLRRLAQQTRSPDPRRELLDLAERFERLAESLIGPGSSEPEASLLGRAEPGEPFARSSASRSN